jgi:hypothetical protein
VSGANAFGAGLLLVVAVLIMLVAVVHWPMLALFTGLILFGLMLG